MIAALVATSIVAQTVAEKKPAGADASSVQALQGDWHGTSLCVVKPSACRDEESLYHIKPNAEKPGKFSMQGDKIVDGKPVNMGTVDCSYDEQKKLLHCEWDHGSLDLTLQGDRLDGAMFLPDKTRRRDIELVKVKA